MLSPEKNSGCVEGGLPHMPGMFRQRYYDKSRVIIGSSLPVIFPLTSKDLFWMSYIRRALPKLISTRRVADNFFPTTISHPTAKGHFLKCLISSSIHILNEIALHCWSHVLVWCVKKGFPQQEYQVYLNRVIYLIILSQ